MNDRSDMSQSEILEECGVTAEQYDTILGCVEKRSLSYKQMPSEVIIGSYNAAILKLLKSNINLKFVTGVYTGLTYQTYLCKLEHTMSEVIKKTSKRGLW